MILMLCARIFKLILSDDELLEDIYMVHSIKRSNHFYIENFIIIQYNIDKLLKYYKSIDPEKKEKAREIAKNLLGLQMTSSEIAKATGLAETEVIALKAQ